MSEYTMAIIVQFFFEDVGRKNSSSSGSRSSAVALQAKAVRSEVLTQWLQQGGRKICLQTDSLEVLGDLQQKATKRRIQSLEIRDAGLTEIPAGSLTVVVLGPGSKSKIEKITSQLQLY